MGVGCNLSSLFSKIYVCVHICVFICAAGGITLQTPPTMWSRGCVHLTVELPRNSLQVPYSCMRLPFNGGAGFNFTCCFLGQVTSNQSNLARETACEITASFPLQTAVSGPYVSQVACSWSTCYAYELKITSPSKVENELTHFLSVTTYGLIYIVHKL